MKNLKAYDLPIRIFHWLFALLFVASFLIAKFVDDESILYSYHMLSGLVMVFLVILRIIWGFLGSETAKFKSFKLKPKELVNYFKSIMSSHSKRYLGHNPASSFAALLMMGLTLGIGFSGYMMSQRIYKHFFEEVHELFAHAFLMIVITHIAGVILHQVRHNDGIVFSMFTGRKSKVDDGVEIKSNHTIVAILFVLIVTSFGSFLLKNFDRSTGQLNAFGMQVQLGEEVEEEDDDD